MTPMIDVVFLLIIFFLVSSHLAKQENQIELELPVARSADDDIEAERPRITVNVKPDGSTWVAGRLVTQEGLISLFKNGQSKEGDDIEVRIRGSRTVPYIHVEPVMLACVKAGIWNVKYAVYREKQR